MRINEFIQDSFQDNNERSDINIHNFFNIDILVFLHCYTCMLLSINYCKCKLAVRFKYLQRVRIIYLLFLNLMWFEGEIVTIQFFPKSQYL